MLTLERLRRLARRQVARHEGAVLLGAFMLVATVFGFIKIAEEMLEGDTNDFDIWLLTLLRTPGRPEIPLGPSWVIEAAQDITAMGGRTVLILVLLSAVGYLALERKRGAMWLVIVAGAGGGLISTLMKYLFGRGRPDIVPHLVTVGSPSFPSGHSMLAAVIYLTLGVLLAQFTARRRIRSYFLSVAMLMTFLVGISRVYLGVHYPSDVLGGWFAGLAWALLCWLVARYLQRRGQVEKPGAAS